MLFVPLLIILLIFPFASAYTQTHQIRPTFNDDWYAATEFIEKDSQKDSFIISWWDFGYFLKTTTNRDVLITGGSQASPATYWMAKALSINNEKLSQEIFTMLACKKDPYKVDDVNKMSNLNKANNLKLNELGDENKVNYNLNLTTCDLKNKNYILVSSDMLGFHHLFRMGLDKPLNEQVGYSKLFPCTYECGNFTVEEDFLENNNSENNSLNYDDSRKYSLIMSPELEDSLFTKLLFETEELVHFKKVFESGSWAKVKVKVYELS